MRLTYRRDRRGRLVELVDGHPPGVEPSVDPYAVDAATLPSTDAEAWFEEDLHPRELEEEEPLARRPQPPSALVVESNARVRLGLRRALETDGYAVTTCPGPTRTRCAAARTGASSERCPRVPDGVRLVLIDEGPRGTRIAEAYAAWEPDAELLTLR